MTNARAFEGISVTHERRLFLTVVHSQTPSSDQFTVHVRKKMDEIETTSVEKDCRHHEDKFMFLITVNIRRFVRFTKMALSIDRDCDRPENLIDVSRMHLKYDGTRAENRFCFSAKRTSPIKSVCSSVQSTTCSRHVRISDSNAGYTMFRCSVKGTSYPLHSPVSPSLPHP